LSEDEFQPKNKVSKLHLADTSNKQQQSNAKPARKSICRKKPEEIAAAVEKHKQESISNPSFQIIHVCILKNTYQFFWEKIVLILKFVFKDALPSLMPDYIVISCNNKNDNEWTGQIRVNISDKEEACEWLRNFSEVSFCDFRVRKVKKENSDRLVFKVRNCNYYCVYLLFAEDIDTGISTLQREYRCHHNTMPRPAKTSLPEKNTNPDSDLETSLEVEKCTPGKIVSNKKSRRFSSKHTGCLAKIRITIKQKTMTWYVFSIMITAAIGFGSYILRGSWS